MAQELLSAHVDDQEKADEEDLMKWMQMYLVGYIVVLARLGAAL